MALNILQLSSLQVFASISHCFLDEIKILDSSTGSELNFPHTPQASLRQSTFVLKADKKLGIPEGAICASV